MKKIILSCLSFLLISNLCLADNNKEYKKELLNDEIVTGLNIYLEQQKKSVEDKSIGEEIYKKRFPEFELAGVTDPVRKYMIDELTKDSKWEIIDIRVDAEAFSDEDDFVSYTYCVYIKSTSSSNYVRFQLGRRWEDDEDREEFKKKIYTPILRAWGWHKDPNKYKHGQELASMENSIESYYYGFTGKRYDFNNRILDLDCKSVNLYYTDIPNYKTYYDVQGSERSYKIIRIQDLIMSATCIGEDNKKYELISYNPNIYRCDSFYTFDCPKEGRIWNSIPSCLTKVDLPKQHLKTFKIETFTK